MLAYRIQAGARVIENFDSDGDHSVGLELLRSMRNAGMVDTVCVATRTCAPTYKHIGKRRFVHAFKTCSTAVGRL